MKRVSGLAILSAVSVLTFGPIAAAEEAKIYECKDAKGEVVYQDEPCLDPPPVKAKPQAVAKPMAAAKPKATGKPKGATKPPVAPKPQAAQASSGEKPWRATFPPTPRARTRAMPGGPVGGPRETPGKTLKTFLDAVSSGDRALVWSCLTSSALDELGPDPAALPLEQLRETVRSFTGYVDEGDVGPFWSIRALRAGIRPKWIFFERTRTGEWKIAGI